MRRRAVVTVAIWAAASAGAVRPVTAQSDSAAVPQRAAPPVIKWGKWAAAAFAIGSTVLGIHQHNAGNNAYRSLVLYCGEIVTCVVGPNGRYVNAQAEATYQRVVRFDRSARAWLVVGQVTAVGSAVLFVLELKHGTGPPNIPFLGLTLETASGVTRVGYRIPIRMANW